MAKPVVVKMAVEQRDLSELLLPGEPEETVAPVSSVTRRKKLIVALIACVATVAIVGIVAGSLAATHNLPSQGSSSSSPTAGFAAASQTSLEVRPAFSAPIGSLASAPPPTVYHSSEHTESARFSFQHQSTTATGALSHTRLEYDVVKRRNAHCPSTHESVLAVACLSDRIRLAFSNASMADKYAAVWVNDTVLFLRGEWGCGEHIRQFVGEPFREGRFLFVFTVNATIAAAFEHANISFFTNHSNPEGPVQLEPRNITGSARRRRSIWSSLSNAFSDIATGAADLANLVVTGNMDVNMQPFSAQYTLPPTTQQESDSTGSVSTTYSGSLTVNSNLELNIQDYSITNFQASVVGTVSAQISAQVQAAASYQHSDSESLISTVTVASGVVVVFGVPIPVNLLLDIYGGYMVSAAASGALSGTATASASASAGVGYNGNTLTPWANANMQSSLTFAQPQLNVQAQAIAFVAPALYLQTAYIGGPTASVIVYGNAQLASGSCVVTEAAGIEIDVGAKIGVSLPHITSWSESTPPVALYGPQDLWTGQQSFC